jgi:hypothetical protein
MGNGDLKKIRSGIIAISQQGLTQTGMILGIIGTFFGFVGLIIVGIAIAIGISQFGAHSTQANKDGISQALVNIAANAYQYKIRPTSMGGGGGRYTGYKIPSTMAKDDNGIYTIRMIAIDDITIIGTSAINTSWAATITADDTGKSTISFDGW